jgi:hypothetical protein
LVHQRKKIYNLTYFIHTTWEAKKRNEHQYCMWVPTTIFMPHSEMFSPISLSTFRESFCNISNFFRW